MLDVLARCRLTKSTDPREKIYALLGLASDSSGVLVYYTKTCSSTVVECHINTDASLDIICQSQWAISNNQKRRTDLRSWVPNFAAPGEGTFLFAQRFHLLCGRPDLQRSLSDIRYWTAKGGRITEIRGTDWRAIKLEPWASRQYRTPNEKRWRIV